MLENTETRYTKATVGTSLQVIELKALEVAGAVVMRKDPLDSCWQQGVNGAGQLHIQAAEAAEIMGGQVD